MIQMDASRFNGLGRFVTETESRYAMIELEMLVGVWVLSKYHSYLFGLLEFTLFTDHQPLLTIIKKKPLDAFVKRGKANRMADTLSDSPVDQSTKGDNDFIHDMYGSINTIIANLLDTLNNSDISQIECDPITLEGITRDPILEKNCSSISERSRLSPFKRQHFRKNHHPTIEMGLQYTAAETQNFFACWSITHRLSSPCLHQSNGLAESTEGLLELRNTPLRHGSLSPSQIVFQGPMRAKLPAHILSLDKVWQERPNEHDRRIAKQHEYARNHFDNTANQLKPIPTGSKVWIQVPTSKILDRTATVQGNKQDRKYLRLLP
ncbi:unnamed protein product [Lepeophtheirus salmonis]|uniref:(salmon louse) hypothetical protein n=1 Tax=Lepeophtheirus salmonis TaxID=72036 RepID=A0A7R8D3Y8_LEPSM|nr:unnamed protein product [Lepeophtheirus salmonis]CAF3021345.1 unnamed protein product [Lepeophtheirus salmonis]